MAENKIALKDIRRAEYNPRYMPEVEMLALKNSLMDFGFVEPVVVNMHECDICGDRKNVLVGGHQRTTATEQLIQMGKVPKGVDERDTIHYLPATFVDIHLEQEKALNLALNKIKGRWDDDKLAVLIRELKGSEYIPSTGFGENEISSILDRDIPMDVEEDGAGEGEGLGNAPLSAKGEVYELGPHRLICGDSTDPETYAKLMNGEKADMLWTDPPYNVAYKSTAKALVEGGKQSISNDDLDWEAFERLSDAAFYNISQHLKAGAALYVCTGWNSFDKFKKSMERVGFELHALITWVKPSATMTWGDYRPKTELIGRGKKPEAKTARGIMYAWQGGETHNFYSQGDIDVWEMPRKNTQAYIHPTEKPDWLPMRAMRNSSRRDDIILDTFAGSGSVMAAAEKTGRRAFMIELDPKFCDEIRKRWNRIERSRQGKEEKNEREQKEAE